MMTQKKGFRRPIAGVEYIGGEVQFHPANEHWRFDTSEGQYEFDISKCALQELTIKMIAEHMADDLLPDTVAVLEWQVAFDGMRVRVTPEVWNWT